MPKKKDEPYGAEGLVISDQFTFEHRNSKGELIATNRNLKNKVTLKERVKRLLRLARV